MTRVLLACLATASVSCGLEEQEVHYANVEAARREGAFSRGWLPDVLPSDAGDIWERHNLDTNETWACFKTPTGVAAVRTKLGALKTRRVDWPATDSPGTPWWPVAMKSPTIEAYTFSEDHGLEVTVGMAPDGSAACLLRKLAS